MEQLKNVLTAIIRIIISVLLLFAFHSSRFFFCTFVNWLRLINVNSRWWYVNVSTATNQRTPKITGIKSIEWWWLGIAFRLCSVRSICVDFVNYDNALTNNVISCHKDAITVTRFAMSFGAFLANYVHIKIHIMTSTDIFTILIWCIA